MIEEILIINKYIQIIVFIINPTAKISGNMIQLIKNPNGEPTISND